MKTIVIGLALLLSGCVNTGGGIVQFSAAAAGPTDLPGGPFTFTNGLGFDVTLTQAVLHVGSLYFNENAQPSIAIADSCIQDGIYVGEELSSIDVDILNPSPQPFASPGVGLAQPALEGEVWLNGMFDVNEVDDQDPVTGLSQVVLAARGSASKHGTTWPFEAAITIGQNRVEPVSNPALPGEFQICTERVVNGIGVMFTPSNNGQVVLRIDPRQIFGAVQFDSSLVQVSTNPLLYQFANDNMATSDIELFDGIRSRGSYLFTFTPAAE
jgi:hypothetical protein